MYTRKLSMEDRGSVYTLYLKTMMGNMYRKSRNPQLPPDIEAGVDMCLRSGVSLGVFDDKDVLIAATLLFDYRRMNRDEPSNVCVMFGAEKGRKLPYFDSIHKPLIERARRKRVFYLIGILVEKAHAGQQIEAMMLDEVLDNNVYASDGSKGPIFDLLTSYGFKYTEIERGYFFGIREV